MRTTFAALCVALFLFPTVSAIAGTPSAVNSTWTILTSPNNVCHWVFPVDLMAVEVTVLDGAVVPAPCGSLALTATAVPGIGNVAVCPSQAVQTVTTLASGIALFQYKDISGCGTLSLDISYVSGGTTLLFNVPAGSVTSPDLTGDFVVNIFDLAKFAAGLPPGYDICADYNCDGLVDVFDLGVWASGLSWSGC